jgi:hypothetical protein
LLQNRKCEVSIRVTLSDIRAIGESEGYKRGQGQLFGTLRTAQDSREIGQNPTNNEHDHRNIEYFHLTHIHLVQIGTTYHDEFAHTTHNRTTSSPVGMFPTNAIVLLMQTNHIRVHLRLAIRTYNDSVEVLDSAETITTE